jgi:hypothetical protein
MEPWLKYDFCQFVNVYPYFEVYHEPEDSTTEPIGKSAIDHPLTQSLNKPDRSSKPISHLPIRPSSL